MDPAHGLWLFHDQTGQLMCLDASPGSTVFTDWPSMDRHDQRVMAAAADSLLNAAGAGRERLNRALRQRYVGDPRGLLVERPHQSDFWRRVAMAGSLGAQVRRLLNGVPVTIDDSHDNTTVARNTGPDSADGGEGDSIAGGYSSAGGGGGGGHGTNGATGHRGDSDYGGSRGRGFADNYTDILERAAFSELRAGGRGGKGGHGHSNPNSDKYLPGPSGGSSGSGIVRIGTGDLALNETRAGRGGGGGAIAPAPDGRRSGGGGGGAGGLVYAVCGGSCSGTASCSGGSGGSGGAGSSGRGGNGGNGQVILFYGNANTVSVTNAVLTSYQLLPGWPRGGAWYL